MFPGLWKSLSARWSASTTKFSSSMTTLLTSRGRSRKNISLTHPRVRTLRRMQDPGLSVAVIDGFSAAEGDVVACIDADLQHDPSILARMLDELQQGRGCRRGQPPC